MPACKGVRASQKEWWPYWFARRIFGGDAIVSRLLSIGGCRKSPGQSRNEMRPQRSLGAVSG